MQQEEQHQHQQRQHQQDVHHDGEKFSVVGVEEQDVDDDGGGVVLLVVRVQADDLAGHDVVKARITRHQT